MLDTGPKIFDALFDSSNMVKLTEPLFQPTGDSQYVTCKLQIGNWKSPVGYWRFQVIYWVPPVCPY